mgnify:CR=1 FL=1|jgi:hypothetical protein|tara:strand:+ start:9563 stop:10180 length:618 start_codon:yes stop_codon:yes gene_type:complete
MENPYQDDYLPEPNVNSMMPPMIGAGEDINNIVGQIDPKSIIDNLDHALKGEQWNKELQQWELNASKQPLVNDECRGAVISYVTGILSNNTTMANLDEKRLSFLMESVIETITKMFITNIERFGFVENQFEQNQEYYNRGSPDTARMTMVSSMVYKVCYLVFSRALGGSESKRIFKSLSMRDNMYGGMEGGGEKKSGWVGKIFGK